MKLLLFLVEFIEEESLNEIVSFTDALFFIFKSSCFALLLIWAKPLKGIQIINTKKKTKCVNFKYNLIILFLCNYSYF